MSSAVSPQTKQLDVYLHNPGLRDFYPQGAFKIVKQEGMPAANPKGWKSDMSVELTVDEKTTAAALKTLLASKLETDAGTLELYQVTLFDESTPIKNEQLILPLVVPPLRGAGAEFNAKITFKSNILGD